MLLSNVIDDTLEKGDSSLKDDIKMRYVKDYIFETIDEAIEAGLKVIRPKDISRSE